MYDFLSLLWRGGKYAYWWSAPNRQSAWFAADDLASAARIFPKAAQQNIFFSIHPTTCIPQTNSRGVKTSQQYVRSQIDHIAAINCVYGDFDNVGDFSEIDCETQPTVIIRSGGGLHCYWIFDEPFIINSDEDLHYAKHLQYSWEDHIGSDASAKDLARVLRVPGTLNYKDEYKPNYPAVEIVECDLTRLYDIAEFETTELPPMITISAPPENVTIHNGWFSTAIHGCLSEVINATEYRNDTLNKMAFRIGQFVPHGIAQEEATALAIDAGLQSGLEQGESEATATGAIIAGMRNPDYGPQEDSAIDGEQDEATGLDEALVLNEDYDLINYTADDGGVLDIWLEMHSDRWLYVTGHDKWYEWTGTHWRRDECMALESTIQALLKSIHVFATDKAAQCKQFEDKEGAALHKQWATATKRSNARVVSVEVMARAQKAIGGKRLNYGNRLNLCNGVLDLNTYEFLPHNRDYHFTYCLDYAYDPDAECANYEQFLSDVLVDLNGETDLDILSLWQELMGYSITDSTKHEVMIWLSGEGSNGKSVALNILQALLGDLSRTIDFHQIGQPGNYDMAEVAGRRVILSTESDKGGRLKEGTIRRIVSGETISSRPIYGSPLEFKPCAKIWWAMNDKPRLADTSNAMWRRLKLIPFNREFSESEKDTELTDRLLEELPGILNFAIRGLVRLRKNNRFTAASAAASALEEYRQESNHVQQWITERLRITESPNTLASSLIANYNEWCAVNNRKPMNSTNLGKELKRLVDHRRSSVGILYAAQEAVTL